MIVSLELCTHWVMVRFVANHYTAKAFYVLEISIRRLGDDVRRESADTNIRPRVYFEEWDDPCISRIRWVSELITIAGGDDCFPELGREPLAKNRIIADPREIAQRKPDIVIGSWCGKKFRPQRVAERPGWEDVPAIRNGDVFEIKSPLILQPGPAALTDGLLQLREIINGWAGNR